jgi:hypothetical protein
MHGTDQKKCCKENGCKDSFSLEGDSGELYVNEGVYQEITLLEPMYTADDSAVGLSLHSIDRTEKHEVFNKFLNKNVKITISINE